MQTGYKCEISFLLEGNWGKPGPSWQGQGICSLRMWVCVRQTTTDWKAQRVQNGTTGTILGSSVSFLLFGTITYKDRGGSAIPLGIPARPLWLETRHAPHSETVQMNTLPFVFTNFSSRHPSKEQLDLHTMLKYGMFGRAWKLCASKLRPADFPRTTVSCIFHCLSSEIHMFTCHNILAWVDLQVASVLLSLRQQGAQRNQCHTQFHVSPATYHTCCHLCRQGRWLRCTRSCFQLLFSKISRFPPV